MYSLHGFEALMREVFFEVCQRLTVVSYCMPGSPQCQVASEILCHAVAAEKLGDGRIEGARVIDLASGCAAPEAGDVAHGNGGETPRPGGGPSGGPQSP